MLEESIPGVPWHEFFFTGLEFLGIIKETEAIG